MLRYTANRIIEKYNTLDSLIARRQKFEYENPFAPYNAHKTNINFSDIDENTLLHYASMMGDMEKIQYCIKNEANTDLKNGDKKTAIELALANDHLEAVKYIFDKGANCTDLALTSCINSEQREWLIEKITTNNNQCVTEFNKLKRAVETGNIELIKQEINNIKQYSRKDNNLDSLLILAAANGQLEMLQFLFNNGASINGKRIFVNTALMEAIKFGHEKIVDYLLSFNNIDIDKENDLKRNALMHAVIHGNSTAMDKILEKNPDIEKLDVDGNTVLHLAISSNPDIFKELFLVPGIKNLCNKRNIYGETPLDLAIQKKNDLAISFLASDMDIDNIKNDKKYGYQPTRISQGKIMAAMLYRLRLKYRSTEYFSVDGNCNGFAFLKSLYAARQMNEYYFSTLALMASWNGDESLLANRFYLGDKPSSEDILKIRQAEYYKNLDDLFEQWSNDVIWFQHSTLKDIDSIKPSDRVQQYSLIKDKDEYEYQSLIKMSEMLSISFENNHDYVQSRARLLEIMQYLLKMPVNIHLKLSGSEHATSGYINSQSLFDYYDPNFSFQTEITPDLDKNIQRILDYKYILLNTVFTYSGDHPCDIGLYCFKKDLNSLNFDQFEIFERSSLPASNGDASKFQYESPNGFTPLHIAVITRSMPCIKQLLQDGYCKIDARDKKNRTAIDIAIDNEFYEGIELFIRQPNLGASFADRVLIRIYNSDTKNILHHFIDNLSDMEIPELFFKALEKEDFELIKHIQARKLINLNKIYSGDRLPLISAIEKNNVQIIEFLLKNDASILKKNQSYLEVTPLKLAMKPGALCFDAIISRLSNINERDDCGETALYYAISNLNADALHKLMIKGADIKLSSRKETNIFDLLYHGFDQKYQSIRMSTLPFDDTYEQMKQKQDSKLNDCRIKFLDCMKVLAEQGFNLSDQEEQQSTQFLINVISDDRFDKEAFGLIINSFNKKIINDLLINNLKLLPYLLSSAKFDKIESALAAGSYADAVFPSGNTCLMGLVKVKDLPQKYDLIPLFIKYGSSLDIKNNEGKTAMDLVHDSDDERIKEIFREHNLVPSQTLTRK